MVSGNAGCLRVSFIIGFLRHLPQFAAVQIKQAVEFSANYRLFLFIFLIYVLFCYVFDLAPFFFYNID